MNTDQEPSLTDMALNLSRMWETHCAETAATPRIVAPPEILSTEWVEEVEAALRRIKKRGEECCCNTYLGPCGCGNACADIADEALSNKPATSSTARISDRL